MLIDIEASIEWLYSYNIWKTNDAVLTNKIHVGVPGVTDFANLYRMWHPILFQTSFIHAYLISTNSDFSINNSKPVCQKLCQLFQFVIICDFAKENFRLSVYHCGATAVKLMSYSWTHVLLLNVTLVGVNTSKPYNSILINS